ncbi:MAG: acyl-ACP--UDP-N-acetylglucosamine O-acyltransferase [Deltaproteobacteria bacterium]|jgi:UDP-N-acetylglucosamine acyltransferase|nr:acyl-ACP--UDP-N-acetylglucosamine O-acyltransferase [Deltaproteobacteria bacterium]
MIHKTAIIDAKAELDSEVEVGPYCIIGSHVKIGKGTRLSPHVVIDGWTQIGEGCHIFQFASIGAIPQDLKYKGEESWVILGNNNVIREFVTINRGTAQSGGRTVIGDHNLLMAYCHVAHDCKIGNHVILANAATLAGHIEIEDYAIVGGLVAVHQFVRLGCHSIIGGFSGANKDIPPYMIANGQRVKLYGLNTVGLKRHNFSHEAVSNLKKAYRIIFRSSLTAKKALDQLQAEIKNSPEVDHLINFIKNSKRGIAR